MGAFDLRKIIFSSALLGVSTLGFSQPFVDIINTSYQSLTTSYKDSLQRYNQSNQNYLNLTIPIKIDSQNTIIARFYGERLYTINDDFNGGPATLWKFRANRPQLTA